MCATPQAPSRDETLTLTTTMRGYHHGQSDMTILLSRRTGERVAALDYSVYEGAPHIQMIRVAENYLRRGLATRMLAALQHDYPDQEIEWGSTTPAGEALRLSLPVRHMPTAAAPLFARLERLRRRLDGFEREICAAQIRGEEPRQAVIAYYRLSAHIDDLAWRLEGARDQLALLDLPLFEGDIPSSETSSVLAAA